MTVLAGVLGLLPGAWGQQPLLQLQGQPYFGGPMTLSVTAAQSIGELVLLPVGLTPLPLDAPIQTSKGPFYIGNLLTVVALGTIPPTAVLNLPFTMPNHDPLLVGVEIVAQGYVDGVFGNPATIPLDDPYFMPLDSRTLQSPIPQTQALFGDRVEIGDLNADGNNDVIVSAWFQDVAGIDKAGSVFVFWGPSFTSSTTLEPSSPKQNGDFGNCLIVSDLDQDGVDDLVVGETTGTAAPPGVHGRLHVYWGGKTFSNQPGMDILSTGTGVEYSDFGRFVTHGDYNNDGWPDIAVGNELVTVSGLPQAGKITVYWGPAFSTFAEVFSPDNGAAAYFGTSLATGDVNGDGIPDLIEGSGRDDVDGVTNLGSVHIFVGPSLTWFATLDAPMNMGFNTRFGERVGAADMDADGDIDVIASDDFNHIFLFEAPALSIAARIDKPPVDGLSPSLVSGFGEVYVCALDVNGDSLPDILTADAEGISEGCGLLGKEGQLYMALSPYFATFHNLSEPVPACGDGFSTAIAFGQLDQDAAQEAVVGAATSDALFQNAGVVWLFGTP